MTPDTPDDDSDGPIDEVGAAAALRELRGLAAKHPELTGPRGPNNMAD